MRVLIQTITSVLAPPGARSFGVLQDCSWDLGTVQKPWWCLPGRRQGSPLFLQTAQYALVDERVLPYCCLAFWKHRCRQLFGQRVLVVREVP